jgi:phospholipid-binding lipoprotein MlaA
MTIGFRSVISGPVRGLAICAVLLVVSACTHPQSADDIIDPHETRNRATHDFNVGVDRAVIRPSAKAYGTVVPDPIAKAVNNFSFNFSEPRNVINSTLQGRLDNAVVATVRFVVNTTVGIGGLFDPATAMGIEGTSTDFGETLYVWGVGEGSYVELPIVGPSTARHTVGRVVDLVTNPLTYVLPVPEAYIGTASSLMWALDTRDEFALTLDDILDNSADSYAQARLLYLQMRRHELGVTYEEDDFDPFAELGME